MSKRKLGVAFGAFTTNDEWGRSFKCLSWHSTKKAATKAAEHIGWFGGPGNVEQRPTLTIDGDTYLLVQAKPITIEENKNVQGS